MLRTQLMSNCLPGRMYGSATVLAGARVRVSLTVFGRTDLLLALLPYGADTPVLTSVHLTEVAGWPGTYIGQVGTTLTGQFEALITSDSSLSQGGIIMPSGSSIVAQRYVYLTPKVIDHIAVDYPNTMSPLGDIVVTDQGGTTFIQNVQAAMTAQGYTPIRADYLDFLKAISFGTGSILVDHNYGGKDNLAYEDKSGSGINGATIQAYRASDFNAGRRSSTYVVAQTKTDIDGRWVLPLMLDPGAYILSASKSGTVGGSGGFGPNFVAITVS